jgi:hypothetical protein
VPDRIATGGGVRLAAADPPLIPAKTVLPGPQLVWAALFLNVLAFSGLPTLIPIPGFVGQLVTQGALVMALLLALLANPTGVVRPSLFLSSR